MIFVPPKNLNPFLSPVSNHDWELIAIIQDKLIVGQISDSSKDQFMLDTFSGRLWRIAESGEIGLFLRTVPYRTAEGEYKPLPKNISELESKNEMH